VFCCGSNSTDPQTVAKTYKAALDAIKAAESDYYAERELRIAVPLFGLRSLGRREKQEALRTIAGYAQTFTGRSKRTGSLL
jgi:hypothetical protein